MHLTKIAISSQRDNFNIGKVLLMIVFPVFYTSCDLVQRIKKTQSFLSFLSRSKVFLDFSHRRTSDQGVCVLCFNFPNVDSIVSRACAFFTLSYRSFTSRSPKTDSDVGLTQLSNISRTSRRSSILRMCPSRSLTRNTTSAAGVRPSSAISLPGIFDRNL